MLESAVSEQKGGAWAMPAQLWIEINAVDEAIKVLFAFFVATNLRAETKLVLTMSKVQWDMTNKGGKWF